MCCMYIYIYIYIYIIHTYICVCVYNESVCQPGENEWFYIRGSENGFILGDLRMVLY